MVPKYDDVYEIKIKDFHISTILKVEMNIGIENDKSKHEPRKNFVYQSSVFPNPNFMIPSSSRNCYFLFFFVNSFFETLKSIEDLVMASISTEIVFLR